MSNYSNTHWISVEESKDCIIFEGSLQSEISLIGLNNDKTDILNAKSHNDIFTNLKVASDIFRKELMKEVVDNADAFENQIII